MTAPNPIWVVMPAHDCVEMTTQAVLDVLIQTVPTRVLLIDQGSSRASNDAFRLLAEQHHPRLLLWSHNPPLPCLSAAWNRALDFVWQVGGDRALVVNNDVRLTRVTVERLAEVMDRTEAWFVSGVGVREGQYDPDFIPNIPLSPAVRDDHSKPLSPGGPDFSCFLLAKAGHAKYRFDERFIPAYCEDLDMHRRYLLGGDGSRIFGVNLPFLHYASGTLKGMTPEDKARFQHKYDQVVAAYTRKWGGGPSKELWTRAEDPGSTAPRQARADGDMVDVRTPTIHEVDKTHGWVGLRAYLDGFDPDWAARQAAELAAADARQAEEEDAVADTEEYQRAARLAGAGD